MFTQRLFSKALKFRGHWQRCADRKCGTPKKKTMQTSLWLWFRHAPCKQTLSVSFIKGFSVSTVWRRQRQMIMIITNMNY